MQYRKTDTRILHTIGDDDGVFPLNGFIGNSLGQVDSQQDRVHLPADRVEGSLKQDCSRKGKLHRAYLAMRMGSLETYGRYCRSSCLPELQDSYKVAFSTHVDDRLAVRGLLLRQLAQQKSGLLTASSWQRRQPWCRAPCGLGRSLCWMRSEPLS